MNIILRSILIAFLVAIPSPFILGWLAGIAETNAEAVTFAAIYLIAFVGCLIMGLTGTAKGST